MADQSRPSVRFAPCAQYAPCLGGKVLYYGIYGQNVEKGGSWVDDVIVGDDLYISPTAMPLFCFHGGVFRTDNKDLYERVRAASEKAWG